MSAKQLCTVQADVAAIQADMKSARAEAAALQSSVDKAHELLAELIASMRQSGNH
jgi:septal ring factor EnvC (AmiA/AmiB activator)